MIRAVCIDVDIERIRIGFDYKLLFQRTQFDEVDVLGIRIGASHHAPGQGHDA